MSALRISYTDALRECDALATSIEAFTELCDEREVLVKQWSKLRDYATKWAILVCDLRQSLDEAGYNVALDDLLRFENEFKNFADHSIDKIMILYPPQSKSKDKQNDSPTT